MTAARAAAEWWAEQIGHPIHKIVRDDETDPTDRATGDFAFMAMFLVASDHPVSDGAAEKFVDALTSAVDDVLAGGVHLDVDYGPCLMLANAAEVAGIHSSRFPFKTHMWVRPDLVTASLGYHGPTRIIWHAPDWVRPQCRQHQYDADWNALDPICSRPMYHDGEHGDWVPDPERCKTCGGSYVDHYGRDAKAQPYTHSWEPAS